ncbi:MAG TPA: hypothetical protein VIJ25_07560 [Methylococcales bacterium]
MAAGSHFEIQYGVIFANGMINNVVTKSQLKFEADLSIRSEVTACFSFFKMAAGSHLEIQDGVISANMMIAHGVMKIR